MTPVSYDHLRTVRQVAEECRRQAESWTDIARGHAVRGSDIDADMAMARAETWQEAARMIQEAQL